MFDQRKNFIAAIALFLGKGQRNPNEKARIFQIAETLYYKLLRSQQIYYDTSYEGFRFVDEFDIEQLTVHA